MSNADIKEVVKEKYGQAALRVKALAGPGKLKMRLQSSSSCYRFNSSSIACISLTAWLFPLRAAEAMPALSRSTASGILPSLARVCADMK